MRPVERRLLRGTAAARPALLGLGGLGVLATALIVAQAFLLAHLLAEAFVGHRALGELRTTVLALLVVVAGRALVAGAFELVGRLGALRVMSELRDRLAAHLLSGAPAAAVGERSGELATLAVQGVDALEGWFGRYLPQVILSCLLPPVIVIVLLPRDPVAAGVLAATVPVLIIFLALVGLAAQARVRARFDALTLLGAHFADVVRGLPTLRAHGRERAQEATLARVGERYRQETMATLRVAFLSAFVLELTATIGTALVAATVGIQLVGGHVGLEAGLAVLLLCPELYAPIRNMGQQRHASEDGTVAAERLFALLDRPAVRAGTGEAPDPRREPIVVEHVTHAYPGRDGDVLHDVSLRLEPGEVVALVGPSGSGKSTLVSLLLRFADPDVGRLSCDVDLAEVDADRWRDRVSWVPQRPTLFAGTVAENVRLSRPEASDAAVSAALAEAGAAFVAELPAGLAEPIGEGGRPLSAGQAQRIALARAFLADRPLLVLDEPTAHLDARSASELDEAITRLAAGRTTLLVVHRPELAAIADRVLVLRDGRLQDTPVLAAVAA